MKHTLLTLATLAACYLAKRWLDNLHKEEAAHHAEEYENYYYI